MERIRAQLEGLLAQLPLDAACLIGDIGLPGAQVQVPQDATPVADLMHRFAAQVAQQPHATALLCDGRELSYAALNTQADAMAVQLQAQGIGPEQLVAVALPRSEQTLVAFLAVLKAGAAYLPLDLDYPAERVQAMLQEYRLEQIEDLLEDIGLGNRMAYVVARRLLRSEEHTSELQSRCEISYAVFCLKKR